MDSSGIVSSLAASDRSSRLRLAAALAAALGLVARPVAADDGAVPRARDVPSIFFIARSTNKNQVHYGVRVDEACNVLGDQPVYGYWRMLEKGGEIEALLGMEMPAYGLDDKQVIERHASTTTIRIKLRAFPERLLVITVAKGQRGCQAFAMTPIAGREAHLSSIYVRLKWPFGIDYLLVRGATSDGQRVQELIQN